MLRLLICFLLAHTHLSYSVEFEFPDILKSISYTRFEKEEDILARTMWGEASSEGLAGMYAVGCVVLNRVKNPREKWGHDVVTVCLAKGQFSCWSLPTMKEMILTINEDKPSFKDAKYLANRVLTEGVIDVTNGADSYYNDIIASPSWADEKKLTAIIGNHRFYKLYNSPKSKKN